MSKQLVGFGAHCLVPGRFVSWKDQEQRNREMLSHALNLRDVIVFVGAGCSVPLGYPTWDQLASYAIIITDKQLSLVQPELDTEIREQCVSRLTQLRTLVAKESASASDLLFILGGCETIWGTILGPCDKEWDGAREFRRALTTILSGKDSYEQLCNWLRADCEYPTTPSSSGSLPLTTCKAKATNLLTFLNTACQSDNIKSTARRSTSDLLHRLQEYEKHWDGPGHSSGSRLNFRRHINTILSPHNPYDNLLKLPVHRFITSNYDCSLEEAIIRTRRVQDSDYIFVQGATPFGAKSFTQDEEYDEQLAMFAIAYADYQPRVFHCHGWHPQPESMIITESDYQRWYLKDLALASGKYRQTIDLIFGSNPILFVGFSLRDEDLLVALRSLAAVESERKFARPIFALLKNQADYSRFEQLYDRYGVHVITYKSNVKSVTSGPEIAQTLAKDLCSALEGIADKAVEGRKQWLLKPKLRCDQDAGEEKPVLYLHYEIEPKSGVASTNLEAGDEFLEEQFKELRDPTSAPRVLALIGPGGTGKSWSAVRVLQRLSGSNAPYRGFFFWSSYYTDDALGGLEQALRYMGIPPSPEVSRLEQFRAAIQAQPYCLVFDGIERFFHETNTPGTVQASTTFVSRFLEVIRDKDSQSTVILTSRLLPRELQVKTEGPEESGSRHRQLSFPGANGNRRPEVRIVSARGFTFEQATVFLHAKNDSLRTEDVARVVSWLEGHRYGITLAAEWLSSKREMRNNMERLRYTMSETDPVERVPKMIGLMLETLTEDARMLLEQLAIFMSPVGTELARHCVARHLFKNVSGGAKCSGGNGDLVKIKKATSKLLRELTTTKVLFAVRFPQEKSGEQYYVTHPTVREYIFRRRHHSAARDLPSLVLSGYSSGADSVYPGDKDGVALIRELFNSIVQKAELELKQGDRLKARYFCRNAFGIVRARMVATTVSRWTTYLEYLGFLTRMIDLARAVSPGHWDYTAAGTGKSGIPMHPDGPLHPDEVAWLYNEAGLAYYGEGSMVDAIAVWEQGYEINKLLDADASGGHYLFQSLCNLGAADIHFGRLPIAELHLRQALAIGQRLNEEDHVARVSGYIALIRHLQGNLADADTSYREAIKVLNRIGNMRATSIFLRHHADLLLKMDNGDEARRAIESSQAIAQASHYPDLVAYARLSLGHSYRKTGKFLDAIREYRTALAEAKRIGITRLEAEAHSELARVALDLGDAQVARRRAMKTLQIANEHVLGLRQTHGMVILGKATLMAGERSLGIQYLRQAKKLADKQQYRLRAAEAESELYANGEPLEDTTDVEPIEIPRRQDQAMSTRAKGTNG